MSLSIVGCMKCFLGIAFFRGRLQRVGLHDLNCISASFVMAFGHIDLFHLT